MFCFVPLLCCHWLSWAGYKTYSAAICFSPYSVPSLLSLGDVCVRARANGRSPPPSKHATGVVCCLMLSLVCGRKLSFERSVRLSLRGSGLATCISCSCIRAVLTGELSCTPLSQTEAKIRAGSFQEGSSGGGPNIPSIVSGSVHTLAEFFVGLRFLRADTAGGAANAQSKLARGELDDELAEMGVTESACGSSDEASDVVSPRPPSLCIPRPAWSHLKCLT
jgi:hypothetical protein